jgi:hypothetical protein
VARPDSVVRTVVRQLGLGSYEFRMELDAFDRPAYAYSMWHSAQLAHALNLPKLSAIEFGVAGGNGLAEMEKLALQIEERIPVKWEIYGFDLGEGLPEYSDYRDCPFIWRKGLYKMDVEAVRSRLKRASLILGPVAETTRPFVANFKPAPLGFISFDLDYYSSTRDAFHILGESDEVFLPRVFCYFDDVSGSDDQLLCEDLGELLAIEEFNRENSQQKIRPIHGLQSKRRLLCPWAEKVYALHRFHHPLYNTYVGRLDPPSTQGKTS